MQEEQKETVDFKIDTFATIRLENGIDFRVPSTYTLDEARNAINIVAQIIEYKISELEKKELAEKESVSEETNPIAD